MIRDFLLAPISNGNHLEQANDFNYVYGVFRLN
ncbi:hypothetical protein NTGBS_650004 [Candidatus Nitrotoga sp. BS]|nr:hypothetical protein NTGBS_650004 [Candidatus Nitrotoga sp. BS]